MRKSLLFLLAASTAMPAMAAPSDGDHEARREARAERAEAARSERSDEPSRPERSAEPAREPQRVERQVEVRMIEQGGDRPAMVEHQRPIIREVIRERAIEHITQPQLGSDAARSGLAPRMIERRHDRDISADSPRSTLERQRQATDSVTEWRGRERHIGNGPAVIEQRNGTVRTLVPPRRELEGRDSIGNRRGAIAGRVPRVGTQPPLPTSTRRLTTNRLSGLSASHWRNHWRSDHRYDWRNHRRHHRSLFHFGFYYDPFGWGYQPYSIGSRLWPNYYRSSYWLNDPWQYRLPYAPPGYRWIRYYDDAVLVDMWDGQVVDVIRDFFW